MNSYELLALPIKASYAAVTVGRAYVGILKVIRPAVFVSPCALVDEARFLYGAYREVTEMVRAMEFEYDVEEAQAEAA